MDSKQDKIKGRSMSFENIDHPEKIRAMSFENVDDPESVNVQIDIDEKNQKAKSDMKNEMIKFLNIIKSTFPEKMEHKEALYKSYIALFSTENVVFKDSNYHRMTGEWMNLWNEAFDDVNQTILDKINPFKRQKRGGSKYKLKRNRRKNNKKTKKNQILKNGKRSKKNV